MVIPVRIGLWSILLIWNCVQGCFGQCNLISQFFKFRRQIHFSFLFYLGLHVLCTMLMIMGSRTQYEINGYQLRMSHCNQGSLLSSTGGYTIVFLTENVFFVRVAAHAASVITAFTCLFPWVILALFLETSNVFSKTSNVFLKTTVSIFGCIHCFQHRFNNSSNTTIRPLFKKVVCFLEKGSMLFEKSS